LRKVPDNRSDHRCNREAPRQPLVGMRRHRRQNALTRRQRLVRHHAHDEDADDHAKRRNPQQVIAEQGSGKEAARRGAATERHRALHVTWPDELQVATPTLQGWRMLKFAQQVLLSSELARIRRRGHAQTLPHLVEIAAWLTARGIAHCVLLGVRGCIRLARRLAQPSEGRPMIMPAQCHIAKPRACKRTFSLARRTRWAYLAPSRRALICFASGIAL
jgi:hypothetical protein